MTAIRSSVSACDHNTPFSRHLNGEKDSLCPYSTANVEPEGEDRSWMFEQVKRFVGLRVRSARTRDRHQKLNCPVMEGRMGLGLMKSQAQTRHPDMGALSFSAEGVTYATTTKAVS